MERMLVNEIEVRRYLYDLIGEKEYNRLLHGMYVTCKKTKCKDNSYLMAEVAGEIREFIDRALPKNFDDDERYSNHILILNHLQPIAYNINIVNEIINFTLEDFYSLKIVMLKQVERTRIKYKKVTEEGLRLSELETLLSNKMKEFFDARNNLMKPNHEDAQISSDINATDGNKYSSGISDTELKKLLLIDKVNNQLEYHTLYADFAVIFSTSEDMRSDVEKETLDHLGRILTRYREEREGEFN